MNGPRRIYLDNAATSWPKPESVYAAVDKYQRENGAAYGRGASSQAMEVARAVAAARYGIAQLIGAEDANQIIFTANGTDSLNVAIHGVLRPGDHAICTAADHNSVLRPLRILEESQAVEVTRVPCDETGQVEAAAIRAALRPNTKLVTITHASNVTGVIEPAAEIGEICRRHSTLFLLDAAQTLGHIPINVAELNCDLLAAPGHKGLLGPLGTGVLYFRRGIESRVVSLRQGGTGTRSEDDRQPETLPDKFEAGNHNVPGLVGLAEGVRWLQSRTLQKVRQHEVELLGLLRDGLAATDGVSMHGTSTGVQSVGVVSVSLRGYDPQEAAALLDASFGVQTRAGLHCAPRMHAAIGTLAGGGTLRFSVGPFTSKDDITAAVEAVKAIA